MLDRGVLIYDDSRRFGRIEYGEELPVRGDTPGSALEDYPPIIAVHAPGLRSLTGAIP
jgi:hypothetical protein